MAHPERLTEPAPATLYFHCHGGNYEEGKGEILREVGGLDLRSGTRPAPVKDSERLWRMGF